MYSKFNRGTSNCKEFLDQYFDPVSPHINFVVSTAVLRRLILRGFVRDHDAASAYLIDTILKYI